MKISYVTIIMFCRIWPSGVRSSWEMHRITE